MFRRSSAFLLIALVGTVGCRSFDDKVPMERERSGLATVDLEEGRLDVTAFLPRAVELAKQWAGDADLSSVVATQVTRDGSAQLDHDDASVVYRFYSRAHAASAAAGDTSKSCQLEIRVTRRGVRAFYPSVHDGCEPPKVTGLPHCSVRQVWERAIDSGAAHWTAAQRIEYRDGDWEMLRVGGHDFHWSFTERERGCTLEPRRET